MPYGLNPLTGKPGPSPRASLVTNLLLRLGRTFPMLDGELTHLPRAPDPTFVRAYVRRHIAVCQYIRDQHKQNLPARMTYRERFDVFPT